MARQEIILGTPPTGLGGDTPRVANSKINAMTSELYQGIGTNTAPLPVSKGGTGGTSQATAQTGLGLVKVTSSIDSTSGNLLLAGWGGLGGQLQSRSYTPDQMFTTQAGGSFSYANNGGAYPAGVTDGALINMGYDTAGQFAYQLLGDWRTGSLYRRGRAAGTSGAWGKIYDSLNSVADPISSGGLMSSALIGGYLVNRYANGEVNVRGIAPLTATIAANAFTTIFVSLPITLVNGALGAAFKSTTNAQPQITYDFYGVVAEYLSDLSTIAFIIRNGATAQTFQPTINVWGRWK